MLLGLAVASGSAMALIRFGTERESPPWLAKLHGFAAVAAIALLALGWAQSASSRGGLFALLTLLVAGAIGVVLNLGYHWRRRPLPEGLVFAHLGAGFVGFMIVLVLAISRAE